ncbi:MAG: ATP-grasp domain-containing protein [Patescibacteria group bacterium]
MNGGNNNENQKTILIVYDILSDKPSPDDPESEYTLADSRSEIEAVKAALKECGYQVKMLGLRRINVKVIAKIHEIDPDAIFNLCESLYDQAKQEMYVAGLYELLKIPYTGSPPLALGLALNKRKTKQILRAAGLPTPSSVLTIKGQSFSLSDLNPPYFIKPVREDASTGISSHSVVDTKEEAIERVKFIHETYNQPALIEEFIAGREINVSIIGNLEPRVLAVGEIDFSKMPKKEPNIVSYQAKWDPKSPLYDATEPCYPAKLEPELQAKIEKAALRAYQEIGCRDYARVDMRLRDDGKFYILEINTNPDISPEAGLDRAARVAGMTYNQWMCEIVSYAVARSSKKNNIELDTQSVI